MKHTPWLFLVTLVFGIFSSNQVTATYSIIAFDKETGICGFAVATNNLAVGSSVGHAAFGKGVLVSQFETNPFYGPEALKQLSTGESSEAILAYLLAHDGHFEGQGTEVRQIALIDREGRVAEFSGNEVLESKWAGSINRVGYAVQGNGLAGKQVLAAMELAFLNTPGEMAHRLLTALEAGSKAGGQRTGSMSAALMVKTRTGWPVDIDLRVDASKKPVQELRALLDINDARQVIISAARMAGKGETEKARALISKALHLGKNWDRIWRRAARLAITMEEPKRALMYLESFTSLNPAWATYELQAAVYKPLHHLPQFQALRKKYPHQK